MPRSAPSTANSTPNLNLLRPVRSSRPCPIGPFKTDHSPPPHLFLFSHSVHVADRTPLIPLLLTHRALLSGEAETSTTVGGRDSHCRRHVSLVLLVIVLCWFEIACRSQFIKRRCVAARAFSLCPHAKGVGRAAVAADPGTGDVCCCLH
ncbi:hypothetical protein Tsubulata_048621 [Turnera subulata]|uniref:Uncharacterized protein n=1 Tax=Turnera subulata TaxID=218843 RepID=A0A9Q0GDV0_9ROSI|nr:hypothetical protein Tsubulata_048621 [Turnera subulata]